MPAEETLRRGGFRPRAGGETERRGGNSPRAALLLRDYRLAVFTATAALVRGQLLGQADGSETGHARPFIACFAACAALTDAVLTDALPCGHEPPHVDGSQTVFFTVCCEA
jgi:hypothetical protein